MIQLFQGLLIETMALTQNPCQQKQKSIWRKGNNGVKTIAGLPVTYCLKIKNILLSRPLLKS
ncbi:MAG: hypothetical protein QNJ70_27145 [Xenococcaceae cyanobacterium MO_207.B15]|nr:hypothetical protein [Xenococcaceae cyanobacterium MO_207.B15]MDJ0745029.1 hypothetical protein [Xenococcaceae cyanobacterium MO_167.B27]